jgi:hypothetical protein
VERIDCWIGLLGGLALVVAVFGVVVYFDTLNQRDVGRGFLARGARSTADEVELRIKSGKAA